MKKYSSLLYWLFILFILITPIYMIGNRLGLYFDSIFPDYAATQLLSGQKYQEKWFVCWPILTQIYHGSLSMWISAFIILVCGGTSVVQHRVINVVIILIILFIIDKILERVFVSKLIRRLGITFIACLPSILGISITQYYIELPGTILVFSAILLATYDYHNDMYNYIKIWLIFFLLGIAIYSYYNFIFFVPGFIIIAFLNTKKYRQIILLAGYGLFPGAMIYLLGFVGMYSSYNGFGDKYTTEYSIIVLIITVVSVLVFFYFFKKDQIGKCFFIGVLELLLFLLVLYCIKQPILENADSLHLEGTYATFLQRFVILYDNIRNSLSGNNSQALVLAGETVNKYQKIWFLVVIISSVFCTFIFLIKRKIDSNIVNCLGIILLYMGSCIPFITRMQGQHFVPIVFVFLVLLLLEIDYLIKEIDVLYILKSVSVLLLLIIIILSLIDRYSFVDRIIITGGKKYYTSQINDLAYDALLNLDNGEKEIYIFPEWGFMAPFNFITNNNVAFSTDYSEEKLELYLEEGYEVNIVFWDDEYKDSYINILGNMNLCEIEESYYKGYDDSSSFYKIEGVAR